VRLLKNAPLPPGEGWGEGIKRDNALILITLTLALSLKGEGDLRAM
jgi:hypothetical protein